MRTISSPVLQAPVLVPVPLPVLLPAPMAVLLWAALPVLELLPFSDSRQKQE